MPGRRGSHRCRFWTKLQTCWQSWARLGAVPAVESCLACYCRLLPIVLCLLTVSGWHSQGQAAPPHGWEVLRVFIWDEPDQLNRLVTRQYTPVLIEELERQLAEENELRKESLLESPMLDEALYVARLDGEFLVSEQSRWKLSGKSASQPFSLGNVSISLRPARVAAEEPQLLDHVQFSPNGALELLLPGGKLKRWFGFSLHSAQRAQQRSFRLRLPAAASGKMLISAPASVELSSRQVVVEKVETPTSLLPGDWTVGSLPSAGTASQWWHVNISGVSNFELTMQRPAAANTTWYKHLVRESTVDYQAGEKMLFAHARFVVAGGQRPSLPLRLRTGSQLRLQEVLVGGQRVQWQVQSSLAGDSHLIELPSVDTAQQELVIELSAACPIETDQSVTLPEIAVAEAYDMNGVTRVYGIEGLVADNVTAAESLVKRIPLAEIPTLPHGNVRDAEQLVWQAEWLGNVPPLKVDFSRRLRPWVAQSLTRFSIQSDWLSASCRLHIDSSQLHSNEVRLRVGANWFVDNIKLVQAGTDLRARLEDRENAQNPVIVISWEGRRENISLDLDVLAHSPRDTSGETLRLRAPRLLTLPDADQTDNYVIEPSARFSVQLDSGLLPYQLQEVNLPEWQQKLLPQSADRWVFRGLHGKVPPLTLAASGGTFSTKVVTVLKHEQRKFSVELRLECLPLSGSIDRVGILLPADLAAERLRWRLQQGQDVSEVPLTPIRGGEAEAGSTVELELPSPLSTPFALHAELPLDWPADGRLSLPVVTVPAAASGESILILPADVATPAGQMPLELLPATVCCSDRQLSQWVADLSPTEQARLVAARMETGVSQNIEMEVRPLPSNSGWGWSESIQHYLYEDGTLRHQLQWEISDTERRAVEVKLPGGWKVEQARIDGKRIQLDSPRQEILSFELPRGGNSTLQLDCTSQRPRQRGWLSFERFERPQISLPVMERQEALWFPPSRVPLREWELTQRKTRLADRLLPSLWWRLLAPTGPALAADSEGPQPNWSRVTLQPLSSHEVQGAAGLTSAAGSVPRSSVGLWTIDKTAFSAFSLASALALGVLAWWGLGTSVRLWWLVLSFCAVAVVLLPPRWLPLGQLILMTVSCTALLRLSSVVGRIRKVGQRPWTGSGVYIQGSTFRAGLLCLLIGAADAVQAQPFRPAESPTTDNREVAEIRPEIFGVLIPVDKERQVSGAWAYAPTRLLELLNSPRGARLRFSQPRILSADYTLRTRRNVANQQEQVQELSAEFRLQFNLADSEIRLPFNRSEVSLLGGTAGGQPLFVGGRSLTQLPDGIVFRPASSGTVRLQLQLEPLQITQLENEASFRCNIPPIPNATLRIVSDGTATFKVRSASGEQKPHTTSASELLGPVDQLAVEWTQVARRALGGSLTAEVYAETWVHARGPQAQAICQLRIRNPRALPRELHLISEPGWEPVGTSWGDGQLIGNEPSSLGGRRVYTVQVVENWHERPQLTMQVVMVPRETGNATTMTLPFLSLQEVSQQAVTRALAWSVEGEPLWRPDSLDFWQEIPAAEGPDWGPLALNVQPKLYRVPMGNNALSLRRLPAGQADAVDEITRVHLSESEARIHYHGQCRTSQRVLTLIIPQSASVDSVLLNNNTPDYRVSQREDYSLIEILPYENMAAFRVLEVRLRQPVELEQATQLPRVVLRGFEAQSSIYRLMRTTGLTCELSTSNELQLEAVSAQPADLLADLETLVGQVDLRDRFRTAQLPLQFTLRPQVALPNISAILYMDRSEQGWKARVKAQWDTTPAALDFIFFELPIAARESLNAGSLPFRLLPMGDSARTTLCLLPRQSPTGKSTVEFEFQLPALASSQAVAVPHVAVLATAPVYPTLALPARIDAQRVRWLRTGRRLDEAWQDPLRGDDRNTDYQYFEMEESHSQVIWKPLENEPQRARLLASRISLLGRQPQLVSGSIDYWIQPGGQLHFPLRLPANCQVLGVQIGGQPAIWHAQEEQLSVLLQPNYMPLRLRLLIQWNTAAAQTATLQLPQVLLTNQSHSGLVVVDNRLTDIRLSTNFNNGVPEGASRALANRWAELLLDALPTLSGQSHEEVETWLPQWHPQAVGFQGSEIVDSPVVQAAMRAFGNEADEGPSAGSVLAVWNAFCSQAKASEALVQGAAADGQPEASDSALTILTSGQGQLNLISLEAPSGFLSQSTAAGLLAAAALLVLVLAGRVRGGYLALLSAHPWVFWLQLAGLCWLLLPVSWPSWILLLAAASMLLGQVNESRRRTHRMARV